MLSLVYYLSRTTTEASLLSLLWNFRWREFKTRFKNHTKSFKHKHRTNNTELSKYPWKRYDKGIGYQIQWKTAAYSLPHKYESRRCDLYLKGKLLIASKDLNVL